MNVVKQPAQPWVWYGGRLSVDFVNTRRNRQASGVEYLTQPGDLAGWLIAAGLAAGPVRVDSTLLDQARELREAIDAGIGARVAGEAFPAAAAAAINSWLAEGSSRAARLEISDGVAMLRDPRGREDARRALELIAIDGARLLGTQERARLRICPGPGCGGRFVDVSPAGRRQWCSMAVCGNRAKAARHRDATRITGGSPEA
jgi:predicted RNA-binding Zn ribbon-like protein